MVQHKHVLLYYTTVSFCPSYLQNQQRMKVLEEALNQHLLTLNTCIWTIYCISKAMMSFRYMEVSSVSLDSIRCQNTDVLNTTLTVQQHNSSFVRMLFAYMNFFIRYLQCQNTFQETRHFYKTWQFRKLHFWKDYISHYKTFQQMLCFLKYNCVFWNIVVLTLRGQLSYIYPILLDTRMTRRTIPDDVIRVQQHYWLSIKWKKHSIGMRFTLKCHCPLSYKNISQQNLNSTSPSHLNNLEHSSMNQ